MRVVTLVRTATQMRVAPVCLDAYRLILQESKTVPVSMDTVFNNLVFIKLFSGKKKKAFFVYKICDPISYINIEMSVI